MLSNAKYGIERYPGSPTLRSQFESGMRRAKYHWCYSLIEAQRDGTPVALTFIVVASGQRSALIDVLSAKSVALSTRNLRMIARKRENGRTLSSGAAALGSRRSEHGREIQRPPLTARH